MSIEKKKRKPCSEETKKKIGDANRGKKRTAFMCQNISNGRKGIIPPREHYEKLSKKFSGSGNPFWNKKHTEETLKKMRGENCHLYRGGITESNKKIRMSLEYKRWRETVFKRDNYTCILCGIRSGTGKTVELNADHIKPFRLYPDLRLDIDNGRTLCHSCHRKTDTYGRPRKDCVNL